MLSNATIRSAIFRSQVDYLENEDHFFFSHFDPHYRFNIIGTGMIGMEHIRVTLLEGRAMIGGIYDYSQKSARAAEELVKKLQPTAPVVHATLEEACSDPSADALIICTPNFTHREVLKTAIKSNKPILLEKPMATTFKDAYEIFRMAQDYSSFIQIGLQYRYKAMYRECYLEAIQNRSIGDIKTITIAEHRLPFLDKVKQWNKFSKFSGGTLIEKCCHYFDLFNLFANSRPTMVSAVGDMAVNFKNFQYENEHSDIIDNAFVIICYENGVKANFNLCMFAPMFHEEITLCGEEGHIHAYETEDFLPGNKIKSSFNLRGFGNRPSQLKSLHYPTLIEESGHAGSTFFEHVQFIENIINRDYKNSATIDEGLWSIIIGAAAEESIRRGNATSIHIDEFLDARLPKDIKL